MELVNFNNAREIAPEYNGSEKKKTMILNNKKYLVKFPDPNRSTKLDISYINNVFSEYIGSKIFKSIGFNTQEVILGVYEQNNKKFIVCGCEDFTDNNTKLVEFEKFENASIDPNPFKRDLNDIEHIIDSNMYNINKKNFFENFWNMFIVDCLIGNPDRHNGNFGFLKNMKTDELSFAPIYDCGSCLYSTYSDEEIKETLNNQGKIRDCIKNTASAIRYNGTKIKYNDFIRSGISIECNNALMRVYPNINLDDINKIIDDINCISKARKDFYKTIIKGKYEEILTPTYKKLLKLEQKNEEEETEEDEEEDEI